jgi:hypothetical protein
LIAILKEDSLPPVAALRHVMREPRNHNPCKTCPSIVRRMVVIICKPLALRHARVARHKGSWFPRLAPVKRHMGGALGRPSISLKRADQASRWASPGHLRKARG